MDTIQIQLVVNLRTEGIRSSRS